MANIPFEYLAIAVPEAVPGTAETAPTAYANLKGTLRPDRSVYEPDESSGNLAALQRSKVTRKWGVWDGSGPLDPNVIPLFMEMIIKGGVTPTQPGTATLVYDWEYKPTMTSDDLDFATIWFGDPNMVGGVLRGTYGICNSLQIGGDASGTDGVTLSVSGVSQFPTKVAAPAMPSRALTDLMAAVDMELYLDTSSAIGTTAVTGRVLSAEHNLDGQILPRYVAAGVASSKSYARHTRNKRSLITTVTMDLVDYTEYDLAVLDDTVVKLRVVHNGAFIENDGSDDFYFGVTVDTYGLFKLTGFGESDGQRTATYEVKSEYDNTLAADWRVMVRNSLSALPT